MARCSSGRESLPWVCPTSAFVPLPICQGGTSRLSFILYGRNCSLTFPGGIVAGKIQYNKAGWMQVATLSVDALVEMRHCGEIGKRDGEGVIGQNTNGRFEYSFWAHCRDGIASLRARERTPQCWIAGNMGVALPGGGDRLVPHIWIHGDGACRRNLPKCSRTDGSLLILYRLRIEPKKNFRWQLLPRSCLI